jgi:hypothetical protein
VSIADNIFSENTGFQIGYGKGMLKKYRTWLNVTGIRHLKIASNLIDGPNSVSVPIQGGGVGADRAMIFAASGDDAKIKKPSFKDPTNQNFSMAKRPLPPW